MPTPKVSSETRVHSGVCEKLAEVSRRRPPPAQQPGHAKRLFCGRWRQPSRSKTRHRPLRSKTARRTSGPAADIQVGVVSAHALFNSVVLSIRCSISRRYFCCAPGHVIIENITARSASSRSKVQRRIARAHSMLWASRATHTTSTYRSALQSFQRPGLRTLSIHQENRTFDFAISASRFLVSIRPPQSAAPRSHRSATAGEWRAARGPPPQPQGSQQPSSPRLWAAIRTGRGRFDPGAIDVPKLYPVLQHLAVGRPGDQGNPGSQACSIAKRRSRMRSLPPIRSSFAFQLRPCGGLESMKSNRCIGKASSDRVERIVPPTIVQAVSCSPPSSIPAFHVAARRLVRSGTSDASARGCAQAPRFSQGRAHSFIARMVPKSPA